MREIDTQALKLVEPALGIGRPASLTRPTVFDADTLQQMLEVNDLVRRGQTLIDSTGIWGAQLKTQHAAPGAEEASFSPYTALDDKFPRASERFDIWLLCLGAFRLASAGAGTLDVGSFTIFDPAANTLFPIGTPGNFTNWFDTWESEASPSPATASPQLVWADGTIMKYPKLRLARGCTLTFRTTAQTDATEFQCRMRLGIFPRALGQDGAF